MKEKEENKEELGQESSPSIDLSLPQNHKNYFSFLKSKLGINFGSLG